MSNYRFTDEDLEELAAEVDNQPDDMPVFSHAKYPYIDEMFVQGSDIEDSIMTLEYTLEFLKHSTKALKH